MLGSELIIFRLNSLHLRKRLLGIPSFNGGDERQNQTQSIICGFAHLALKFHRIGKNYLGLWGEVSVAQVHISVITE